LPEQLPHFVEDFALYIMHAVLCVRNPEAHLQFNGGLAEGQDKHIRWRRAQDPKRTPRRFPHQGDHLVKIRVMRYPNLDLQPDVLVIV
jgi:hypothetical protein